MSHLDTQIKLLLGAGNDPTINKKVQRIKQKCQNNKTLEKILTQMTESKQEEPQQEKGTQRSEKMAERDEELLAKLAEKREAINKARKALDERLNTLNGLSSTKTRLLDEYTLGLSQTSSDNLMEPMMKLKKFIKNEEEMQAAEVKCQDLNQEIKDKTREANESLGRLSVKGQNTAEKESEHSHKSQKIDDSFAEKMIQDFVENKRRGVLEDLENREATKTKINERKAKYEQICAEFAKALEAQEPYLKQKIEDSVHKTINIEEKKTAIKRLQTLVENLRNDQKQGNEPRAQDSKAKIEDKAKESSGNKDVEGIKEEDILGLIGKNKDTLRHIQASKIRINEFVANNTLATLEEVQKASKGLEANLAITFENWEKIYMLPADVYYTNMPEENYSPVLQEMMNLIGKPNKAYFYLPKLIQKITKRLEDTSADRLHLENAKAEEELKTNQRVYQQKKRKQISELIDVKRELETEIHYKERIENLLETCEHPPAIACADILKQYEGWTLSDYLEKWKKHFAPVYKEDY